MAKTDQPTATLKQPAAILKFAAQASLNLISALEGEVAVTQHRLAARIGVVLTLTYSLLKRCVLKGLIKVSQVSAKSCLNYITLKVFKEKRRLVSIEWILPGTGESLRYGHFE